MENNYKNFITTLYNFLSDLNRYDPTEGISKVLKIYKNLDMSKIIFGIYHLLNDNSVKISTKDESLFQNSFIILPNIDLSLSWPKLTQSRKDRVFTYLNMLLIVSDLLVNNKYATVNHNETNNADSEPKKETSETQEKQLEFDPYVGVGTDNPENYSVEQMYSNIPTLEEDRPQGSGLETIVNMIGLDKMIDLEALSNQLKNMKKEDIDLATNNLKELLGNNVDEATHNLISDMLTNITEEMKAEDLSKGTSFNNMVNVARRVASKVEPTMRKNNVDMSKLLNATQIFSQKVQEEHGNTIPGDNGMNPFSMLGQLANNINQSVTNGKKVDQTQCIEQCNNMLKNMGISNIDLNNLNSLNINDIARQLQTNRGGRNNGSGRGRNNNNIRGGKRNRK